MENIVLEGNTGSNENKFIRFMMVFFCVKDMQQRMYVKCEYVCVHTHIHISPFFFKSYQFPLLFRGAIKLLFQFLFRAVRSQPLEGASAPRSSLSLKPNLLNFKHL